MKYDYNILKSKLILSISVIFFIISILLTSIDTLNYKFLVTSININELANSSIPIKTGKLMNKKLIEVHNDKEESLIKKIDDKKENESIKEIFLPTEYGNISSYPSYYHTAYDITSPRGSNETIYPIASGVISSMYKDSAGALIVTVRHIIDGKYYTSLYAHLSNYANIYVGQEVSPTTPLGWMGTTGNSYGVHLHLSVIDCNLFGNTDSCSDLGSFFEYSRIRYSQGFIGLGNLINIPYEWQSR